MPRRMFARLLAIVIVAAAIGPNPAADQRPANRNYGQAITAIRVALNPLVLRANRVDGVIVTEIWRLTSPNTGFGGFSGMVLLGPRHFMIGTDRGIFAGFKLLPSGRVTSTFIAPLQSAPDENGRIAPSDMEAMTNDPDSGQIWAAYERRNEIRRFSRGLAQLEG